jgi:hypothetical protein
MLQRPSVGLLAASLSLLTLVQTATADPPPPPPTLTGEQFADSTAGITSCQVSADDPSKDKCQK